MDTSKLLELMKQKKAAIKKRDKTIKPLPGSNRYILLPGWRETEREVFWHDFGQHYIKNAADEIQAVYPCNEAIYGKSCSICEGLNRAAHASTDDETTELLKKAKAGRSYLVNVLALDSEDPHTPQILEIRSTVFEQFINAMEEWGTKILNDEEANIVIVERSGKGLNTKYAVQVSPKTQAVPKSAMSKLNNLDEYVQMESEEQMRKALLAINSVAGYSVPALSADRPKTLALASEDLDGLDSIADVEIPEKPKAKASAPALAEELDDLLGELN